MAVRQLVCVKCSLPFYVLPETYENLEKTGQAFHCPNGHELKFTGPTFDSLQKKLTEANEKIEILKRENLSLLSQIEQLEAKLNSKEKCDG